MRWRPAPGHWPGTRTPSVQTRTASLETRTHPLEAPDRPRRTRPDAPGRRPSALDRRRRDRLLVAHDLAARLHRLDIGAERGLAVGLLELPPVERLALGEHLVVGLDDPGDLEHRVAAVGRGRAGIARQLLRVDPEDRLDRLGRHRIAGRAPERARLVEAFGAGLSRTQVG